VIVGLQPEVWIAASFASSWFADALNEARTGQSAVGVARHGKARESRPATDSQHSDAGRR